MPEGKNFFFAGPWSSWKDLNGELYESFSFVTTSPNAIMGKIHDRMPVTRDAKEEKYGLDPDQNPNDLISLLKPYPTDAMKVYRISSEVSKPANNYAEI